MTVRRLASITAVVGLLSGLVVAMTELPGEAAFPGVNGRIAFDISAELTDIYTMPPTVGASAEKITTDGVSRSPRWSADGTRIAYTRSGDGGGIWVMNADGSGKTALTANTSSSSVTTIDSDPAWSPDGSTIVFERYVASFNTTFYAPPRTDLLLVDVSTKDVTPLLQASGAHYRDPAWSFDGAFIALVTTGDQTGGDEIHVVRPDGSGLVAITCTESQKAKPDWRPSTNPVDTDDDGYEMVYQERTAGGDEIFKLASSDSCFGGTQLTKNGVHDQQPTWSPDSRRILFVSQRDGNNELYTMTPSGGSVTRLTTTPNVPELGNDWQATRPVRGTTTTITTTTTTTTTTTPDETETTTTTTLPVSDVALLLDRRVGQPGSLPVAIGNGFDPGANVRLRWEPGLGSVDVVADGAGSFVVPVLVLPKDRLGDRRLLAEVGGVVLAAAGFKVVAPTVQPGGFSVSGFFNRG